MSGADKLTPNQQAVLDRLAAVKLSASAVAVACYLAQRPENVEIAIASEIRQATALDDRECYRACCDLEALGLVEWFEGRMDGDRPGGWSATRPARHCAVFMVKS